MTEKVKEQIFAIRETGETNMFDTALVQRMAYDRGFYSGPLSGGAQKGIRPLHSDR